MDVIEQKKEQILSQTASWPGVKRHTRKLLNEYEDLIRKDERDSKETIWDLFKRARDLADSKGNERLSEYLEVGMSYLTNK